MQSQIIKRISWRVWAVGGILKIISPVKLAILTSLVFGEHNIKNRDAYGDDDDYEDDDGEVMMLMIYIYIMMQCVSVTKNDHFPLSELSARGAKRNAR